MRSKIGSIKWLLVMAAPFLLFVSCSNQMNPDVPGSEDNVYTIQSAENSEQAYVYTDSSRGIAVYVDESGNETPIQSEEKGNIVSCTGIIDFISLEPAVSESRGLGPGGDHARGFVLGKRDDDKPGFWVVYSSGKVSPAVVDNLGPASELYEMVEGRQPMSAYFNWSYEAFDMISNVELDEIIIIGYAENSGIERRGYSIDEGTTVGVYWSVTLDEEDFYHISRAKVIGYKDLTGWKSYFRNYMKSDRRNVHRWMWKLRRFFAGWYDTYLVMPDSIDFGENEGEYLIYGTDQADESAVAAVTVKKVLSIEPWEEPVSDNNPPVASFPEGDYQVSGAGLTAVNGIYEETGTLNSKPLYTQIGGDYKLFYGYYEGHLFPPPPGYFWCIDTSEATPSVIDMEYWKYGEDKPPSEGEWRVGTGEADPPVISPVTVFSGSTGIGETLTINYTYFDPDGDLEGATGFRWFRYDPADSTDTGTLIPDVNGSSYTTDDFDNGMYLKVEVTPFDDRGLSGATVLSESSDIIGN